MPQPAYPTVARNPLPAELDVLVVGAGFTGLYMQLKLREAGFSSHVVEAGGGVGGTWYWNRYPGARCDIPSIEYSYSFSPELERDWRWSERYAAQPEILAYLEHVAERFDLLHDITLNTRVVSARWNEAASNWSVETDQGDRITAHFLVLGTGALSAPKLPDLPGLGDFAGPILHTALWDDKVELAGRNIAIFGTGSSGIQAIPQLAQVAAHVTVFQRTPSYAVPASNRTLDDADIAAALTSLSQDRETARQSPLGFFGAGYPGSAKEENETARQARFEQQWNAGTTGLLQAYEDLLFDEESNALAAKFIRGKIAALVRDPDKVRRMSPDYPVGSRRLCSEIGYYETMARDDVTLIDVREDPVAQITADAVVTASGARHPADVIVFATGFDACVGAIKAIAITGRDGAVLRDEWDMGPRCYLGLAVAGFPNLFTVTGPGSPSVLSNVVVSIEQHVEWITRCLVDLRERNAIAIEADPQAEQAWMHHADEVAQQTLFPRGDSWYKGRTRDGRDVFMPYVGGVGAYRQKCEAVAAAGYEGFRVTPAAGG